MSSLSERVESVERGPSPHTLTPMPEPDHTTDQRRLWCDRPLNKPIPTDPPVWPDDEVTDPLAEGRAESDGCQLHRISQPTETLLKDAFSNPVANATRQRWRHTYGMPASENTKCPKLDNTVMTQVQKGKDNDQALSRLQALVLDAAGPLTSLLEQKQEGRTPDTGGSS